MAIADKARGETSIRFVLGALLLVATTTAGSAQGVDPDAASAESAACLGCHDFGPDSPVHAVLAGSHGISGDSAAMAGRRGCPDCHGDSAAHADDPSDVSPGVSFGPRWTATSAAQDQRCLACHEDGVARNWRHALHMFNNLTCVTCHDVHSWEDKVLFEEQQTTVCTTCHKAQKAGIHGLENIVSENPPCSQCHNPHDHESAESEMLDNGSAGCVHCHDPTEAPAIYSTSPKANNYHQVMSQPDRTCLDCHKGIAHLATDAGPAASPQAVASRKVTLFYPGMADSDWLLQDHPGSQPLRQGRNCAQCHRGEEAAMGEIQAGGFEQATRPVQVSFSADNDSLVVTLQWRGPENDADIAMMWGDDGSDAFRRGGCFAACHSDLPGMSRDSGLQTGKYLWTSRQQEHRIGQPSQPRDAAALEQLMAAGEFVELWRVRLDAPQAEMASVLEGVSWRTADLIQINKSYDRGWWTVVLRRSLRNTDGALSFTPAGKYTFGVALHGAGNPGGQHWVSLPLTLSFSGDETDFEVEQE